MSGKYLSQHGGTKATPQTEKASPEQVENSTGGFVFSIGAFERFKRFLILGAEGGTFYVGERAFVRDNLAALEEVTREEPMSAIATIQAVSKEGRAKSNDPALFALAYISVHGSDAARTAAYDSLPVVARIGTHLFHFIDYREGFGGWSRGLRRAVGSWYNDRPLESLAMQLVKYRQRDGWSHRDLLRLAHVKPNSPGRDVLFKFAVSGEFNPDGKAMLAEESDALEKVRGYIAAQAADTPAWAADAVRRFALPREAVKPEHLNAVAVWQAMLDGGMPVEAMVRNLATMTRNGTLKPLSEAEKQIVRALTNGETLGRSRLHPLSVLNARAVYGDGGRTLGLSQAEPFAPSNAVLAALDDAFHLSFGNVEPAGKRFLLGLDVSGSMGSPIGGSVLACRAAAAAMALVTMKTEAAFHAVAFTSGGETIAYDNGRRGYFSRSGEGLLPLDLTGSDTLAGVLAATGNLEFGGTDCALPMIYATERELEVDAFVIYTDNETWAGTIHPAQALAEYRRKSGIDAKLIVVGMTSTGFSIADPKDPGMLDVVGFDTATPNLLSAFARGDL